MPFKNRADKISEFGPVLWRDQGAGCFWPVSCAVWGGRMAGAALQEPERRAAFPLKFSHQVVKVPLNLSFPAPSIHNYLKQN